MKGLDTMIWLPTVVATCLELDSIALVVLISKSPLLLFMIIPSWSPYKEYSSIGQFSELETALIG